MSKGILIMNKILTVSIAAYNVEKYLEQTLSSLNDSRFIDDIEVLIVDDGSTDHTKDIALKYQNIAPDTFKYVKKENGGHGSTINKGIELASGKYFRVIDGDDWVDTDAFAQYIHRLKNTDTDIVLTQHKTVHNKDKKILKLVKNMKDGTPYLWTNNIDIQLITLHMLSIKTNLLKNNNVRITENCFYVDIEFVIWAIYLSESITYFEIPVYMYRIGNINQSINKKNMIKNVEMQEKVSYKLTALFKAFVESNRLSGLKETVIFKRIAKSIGSTVRTYLLFDDMVEANDKIISFDRQIRNISSDVYDRLGEILFFSLLRWNEYFFVPILKKLYKIWCIRYR